MEIIGSEQRKGVMYHMMRDLRNGNVVKNVTRSSARRLWHYAISEHESSPVQPEQVQWRGDIGLWKRYKRGGMRHDLVQRANGELRVYYGVTYDGMAAWQRSPGRTSGRGDSRLRRLRSPQDFGSRLRAQQTRAPRPFSLIAEC